MHAYNSLSLNRNMMLFYESICIPEIYIIVSLEKHDVILWMYM